MTAGGRGVPPLAGSISLRATRTVSRPACTVTMAIGLADHTSAESQARSRTSPRGAGSSLVTGTGWSAASAGAQRR